MAGLFRIARQARVAFPRLFQQTPSTLLSTRQHSFLALPSQFTRTYATTKKATKSPAKRPTAAKKSTKKPTKKAPKKAKKAKKVVTKKPTKRLTPEQKATKQKKQQRETIKALKVEALTIPKALPTNVFAIFMSGKKGSLVDHISSFKSLPTAEVEKLHEQAKSNTASNKGAYEHWVKSHSPLEIKIANDSRRKLTRLGSKKYPKIQDDRQVKGTKSAYLLFVTDKFVAGEHSDLSAKDRISTIARSWQQAPASEREKYERLSQGDQQRYIEEYKTTYGTAPQLATKKTADS